MENSADPFPLKIEPGETRYQILNKDGNLVNYFVSAIDQPAPSFIREYQSLQEQDHGTIIGFYLKKQNVIRWTSESGSHPNLLTEEENALLPIRFQFVKTPSGTLLTFSFRGADYRENYKDEILTLAKLFKASGVKRTIPTRIAVEFGNILFDKNLSELIRKKAVLKIGNGITGMYN